MTAWMVFALAGMGTYLSRALFILVVGERVLPPAVERGIRNIGPAVLAALTASLLTFEGLTEFLFSIPEVSAVVAGTVFGLWRRTFVASFLAAITTWATLTLLL